MNSMLTIQNYNKLRGYRFGEMNEWELYGIDYTSYENTYVFELRKRNGNANEYFDIELNRIAEYHNATGNMVYKMNGRKWTLDYLRDINNMKIAIDYTIKER